MVRLLRPSIKYKKSFLSAVKEFQAEGRDLDMDYAEIEKDFAAYVKKLENEEKGINLKPGRVPASVFWLIDGDKYIGRVSIRHKLIPLLLREGGNIGYSIRPTERKKGYGSRILALALKKAKMLGIKKALLTCNDDNIGSRKIIEKNGGVLENVVKLSDGKLKRRYWINIT